MTVAARELRIDAGRAGLPELAHGGYVAGVLSAALGRRELPRPAAPAGPHRRGRCGSCGPAPGQAELHDGAGLLADARRRRRPAPRAPGRHARGGAGRVAPLPGRGAPPDPRLPGLRPRAPARPARLPGARQRPRGGGRALGAARRLRRRGRRAAARAGQRRARLPAAVGADGRTPRPATSDRVVTSVLETRLEAPVARGRAARRDGLADRPRRPPLARRARRSSARTASCARRAARRRPSSAAGASRSGATTGPRPPVATA